MEAEGVACVKVLWQEMMTGRDGQGKKLGVGQGMVPPILKGDSSRGSSGERVQARGTVGCCDKAQARAEGGLCWGVASEMARMNRVGGRLGGTIAQLMMSPSCCCSATKSCLTLQSHGSAAHQASLSLTIFWSLLMSIESVMLFNHLILSHPLLLLPSIFPSISHLRYSVLN